MAEPIPSASNAVDAVEEESATSLPKNAEDRKAAAALDALNAREMSQEPGEATAKQPSAAAQEALGKAMSRLEMANGIGKKQESSARKTEMKKEAEVKKKVKISSEDVNLLVTELDLTKNKATELLRAHDGSADLAIRAFLKPAVQV